MLYPKSLFPLLDEALFKMPTEEYRGAPFWAWNAELDEALLSEQLDCMKQMGFGGVHTHPRTGLLTPYLGEKFMSCVKFCVEAAKKKGMRIYLYDEDRWPSGFAGGFVTQNEQYRRKHILFTTVPYIVDSRPTGDAPSYVKPVRTANGQLLAVYDVVLDSADMTLKEYRQIDEHENACGTKWYAYLESDLPSSWYNNRTYVDTLNKDAIAEFVAITHEAYKQAVGDAFGETVPSIFTDEPMFTYKTFLPFPEDTSDVVLPWTDKFSESFKAAYGLDIMPMLPELLWELPHDEASRARYLYHDHVTELFVSAFADTCGAWCSENNLLLTGHLMREPTLYSQSSAVGEAMRSYRSFGLPGVDMLANHYEYTSVKQAQSVAHQYGREGVLSELYGITNWSFDFRMHKLQGDWQAALGVTNRVPHLSMLSMSGEAKRDYPASINYQAPWHLEYPVIETHFARLNTAMTRGKPVIKVGVIHPIESFWLHWGPLAQTNSARDTLEQRFSDVTQWLLFDLIDFNYISEALLPEQCKTASNPLAVGKMEYDVVIVPGCETIRKSTLDRLKVFKEQGGTVIFMGKAPSYVDSLASDEAAFLAERCNQIPFEKAELLKALAPFKELELRLESGVSAAHYLSQLRQDGDCRWLLLAQGKPVSMKDVCTAESLKLQIRGEYTVELYDTISGEISTLASDYKNGKTILAYSLYPHDCLLLKLSPCTQSHVPQKLRPIAAYKEIKAIIPNCVPITLHEPNVLLLDRAELSLNGGVYRSANELLRADNELRKELGMQPRQGSIAQPWVTAGNISGQHNVRLRFVIKSKICLESVMLALEESTRTKVIWNDKNIPVYPTGYYVDHSIATIALGGLNCGENILEIDLQYDDSTNLEWFYILGDFGVSVRGKEAEITAPVRELSFGDITYQGLPFYGGNLTYHLPCPTAGDDGFDKLYVHIPHYRGAMIAVECAGERQGTIIFAPYTIQTASPKSDKLDITLFGNRVNSFGAVHLVADQERQLRPRSWRSEGDEWSEEYVFEPVGILSTPIIKHKKTL